MQMNLDLNTLTQNFRKYPALKSALIEAINELDAETKYANQDVDRRMHVYSLLQRGCGALRIFPDDFKE